MRQVCTVFVLSSVLVSVLCSRDLATEEAQIKDVIQGVVGRYLGQSRESEILSSALTKAFEDEGLSGGSELKHSTEQPNSVSLAKRDIRTQPLPPPELFLDLLGESENPNNKPTIHMETANTKKNCTKRKKRRKKTKTELFTLPSTMSRHNQRALDEYSNTGVPPAHVEIPRLYASEQQYFDEVTTVQEPFIRIKATTVSPPSYLEIPDIKQKYQDRQASFSEQAPPSYQIPSTYFAVGSSTLISGNRPTKQARKNPFEKLESTTKPDTLREEREQLTESHDVPSLVPRRTKNKEQRTTTTTTVTTPFPVTSFKEISDLSTSDPDQITSKPLAQIFLDSTSASIDNPERQLSQYALLPKNTLNMATTVQPVLTSSVALELPDSTGKSPESSHRTLVPSSLNKGTLQHFSFYPKQPKVGIYSSKIILAVGGARYSPLPANVTKSLESLIPRAHEHDNSYNAVVVAKQTSSVAAVNESRALLSSEPVVEKIRNKTRLTEPIPTPLPLLPMSPKVVSGQVLVFSSINHSVDSEVTQEFPKTEKDSKYLAPKIMYDDEDNHEEHSTMPNEDQTTPTPPNQTFSNNCSTPADISYEVSTSQSITELSTPTARPIFGSRVHPISGNPLPTSPSVAEDSALEVATEKAFMPDAPTILMQVPLPDNPDLSNHGYAKGSTQLHIPFVYKLQKTAKVSANKASKQRTLISLPNSPFARLSPVSKAYYKYKESTVKGYLPKAFLKLERLHDVKVVEGPQRSMVVFE